MCDVVGLIKIRAKKGNGDIVPGESPTLVTQLLFINGFADAIHSNHFTLACQPDPKFGSDSQGHISSLCVERCYLCDEELNP